MPANLEQITRKEAQAALHSPEQLDQLMIVTRARGWITLLVAAVAIMIGLGWGVFGTVAKTVKGHGMLLPALDPVVLHAQGAGLVLSFGVAEGETVEAGRVLVELGNTPLKKSLDAAREMLETLRNTDGQMTSREKTKLEIARKQLEKKQTSIQRTIQDADRLIQLQKQQLGAEAKLLDEGLIPKQQWIQSQRELARLIEQKLTGESQLQQVLLELEQTEMSTQQARDERALQIISAQAQLDELKAHSHAELKVTSPIAGKVLEFRVGVYTEVAAGQELVEILPLGISANRFVAYVDAGLGKKIEAGMPALVSPSIAEPERYGYILGKVTGVSETVSSKAEMVRIFENDEFSTNILKTYAAPLQVVIALQADTHTASGFHWTSSSGLPHKIGVGTLCSAQIEVERDRPIALFIPWLKKSVGIYD